MCVCNKKVCQSRLGPEASFASAARMSRGYIYVCARARIAWLYMVSPGIVEHKDMDWKRVALRNNAGYAYRNNCPIIREPYAILKSILDVPK